MISKTFVVFCFHILFTAVFVAVLYKKLPGFDFYYSSLANLILYTYFAYLTYHFSKRYLCGGKIEANNKAVLITGCDSGFGNELAKRLDSKGFEVFATCLFPEGLGAKDLKRSCSDKLRVLYLDVTKEESIEKAVDFVKNNLGTSELWALVNNAGIFKGVATEFTPINVLREVLEVNTIGPVRVTKAFLPLVKKSKGRIVNVSSLSGRLPTTLLSAYTMSKHALVAYTECLSQEMKIWGVEVISIEPEVFNTPMADTNRLLSSLEDELTNTSEEIINAYGEDFILNFKQIYNLVVKILASSRIDKTVDDMESAVADKYPDYRYDSRGNIFRRLFWFLVQTFPWQIIRFMLDFCFRHTLYAPLPKDIRKQRYRKIPLICPPK